MSILWTAEEAARATGGKIAGSWQAMGVSIDTRTLEPGDLFVALTGEARDGHQFVADAIAKGAVAALVSRAIEGVPAEKLLIVADTLDGLNALGRAARARTQARVAAVTGSVGKTSSKEALKAILSPQGKTHASVASYNNLWGVPLTLARMPADTQFAIIEIGMNHADEIRPLTRLARPHAALITTVEAVHIEHFSGIEGIADAKAEIFEGLEPGGAAVINHDNSQYGRVRDTAQRLGIASILSFGSDPACDAALISYAPGETGSQVTARVRGQTLSYVVGAPGRHLVQNSLGILLVVSALGADVAKAAASYAHVGAAKGRGSRSRIAIGSDAFELIDESYNANPASMAAALALLGEAKPGPSGRRIAVLGDMLELGPGGPDMHEGLIAPVTNAGCDLVFCSGKLMARLWAVLPPERRGAYAETSAILLPLVDAAIRAGDVVMVKGSFGSRMGLIVDALKSRQTVEGAVSRA
ncbi:MAG TPA: UDP-N-acetylmuramoylalanyl-D-glutamyl-2,6-diaminopimelate--D-alanyl-D-alanine ligase [Micropepsaceae bacterium]|nr:UDP-N-acetylmuramoylalanyl-D-glutamyl-2,6-diaminopimelate--D-alanyl-D-alanine ligase [Micropepsaceae bacterium]